MWESPEQKRKAYLQMYGGLNSDSVIQLTESQLRAAENMRLNSNPCLEVPVGLGKACILGMPVTYVDAYPPNYQLLMI